MSSDMTFRPHASDEMLAAFAEGRLKDRERTEVMAHAAGCDDCREILVALGDAAGAGVLDQPEAPVLRGRFTWVPRVLAIAAVVAFVAFLPPVREWIDFHRTGGVSLLIEAAEERERWPLQTRLSGFPAKEPEPRYRGADRDVAEHILQFAQLRVMEAASERSARDQRAVALAHLLRGERNEAVSTMERAVQLRGKEDPVYFSDLAAAYLERGAAGDDARALRYAQRAWRLARKPEAAWNLAVAYERNGLWREAIRTYREYLQLDAASPFAAEARERIDSLTKALGPR